MFNSVRNTFIDSYCFDHEIPDRVKASFLLLFPPVACTKMVTFHPSVRIPVYIHISLLPLECPSLSDLQMETPQGREGDRKKIKKYRGVSDAVMNRKRGRYVEMVRRCGQM